MSTDDLEKRVAMLERFIITDQEYYTHEKDLLLFSTLDEFLEYWITHRLSIHTSFEVRDE